MDRKISFITFLVVSFFSLFISAAIAEAPFRVGAVLPLSGGGAYLGQACKNGIALGLQKLPEEFRNEIEVFYEDDALESRQTVSAFQKLVSVQKIELLITMASGNSNAVAPLAERQGVVHMAVATDPKVSEGKKYVMNFWVTPEAEAAEMVSEVSRRGYKNIARISAMQDGVLSFRTAFDALDRGDLKIHFDEEYPPDVRDFKTYISKLKGRSDLDGVMALLWVGQIGIFSKQMKELGVDLPMFGMELYEDSNEVLLSGGALVGDWYVNADDPSSEFSSRYSAEFADASISGAPNCHDIVLLISAGLQEAKSHQTRKEDLNDFLHNVKDFQGSMGTYSATGDNRFSLPAAAKIVTESGFEKISHN